MGLIDVVREIDKTKKLKNKVEIALAQSLADYPKLQTEYESWIKTYRLNSVACCAFVASQLCKLEGVAFDKEKSQRTYLGAAAACISDDLIDKQKKLNPEEVYFLDTKNHSREKTGNLQGLFYALHSRLEELLPQNFESHFKELINKYNEAQRQGRKLNEELSNLELTTIKNNTGGYPAILFYKIIFPCSEDFSNDFIPYYAPKEEIMPKTKKQTFPSKIARLSTATLLKELKRFPAHDLAGH